jgi:hypothetical protein
MSEHFHPQLLAVRADKSYRLVTQWSTGEVLTVDIEFWLRKIPALESILEPSVFEKARLTAWGNGIEWFDSELGADNVYAWAKEQSGQASHQMFDHWMRRNHLSLSTAAEALGLSRRMVSYYRTAQKSIPKTVWLACIGWEATKQPSTRIARKQAQVPG